MEHELIMNQTRTAVAELLEQASLRPGSVFVVGCSSSEIVGASIGQGSSLEAAQAVFEAVWSELDARGIILAAQCCEHLNRALVIEREAAEKLGLDPVCVIPQPKAGGSFATTAWRRFRDPVTVESIRADAGIDIGDTLIGMHLKPVAVPVRVSVSSIGEAHIVCARTRPKLIGGARAVYGD